MDQVKLVMRQIVIHRFWVLSGLITVIGLVGWLMAVGSLLQEYEVNKGKIEGQYSAITAVRGVKNHPNEFSHRRMDEIQNDAKQQVAQAWMQQYQQQVGVLVWPQRLQRDFEEAVIKLRPAEKIPYSDNYQQDIDKELRSRYRDYIQEVLPQLATIIKSNWDAKAGAGGMGGMGGMAGAAGGSGMSGFGGAMPGMGGGPGGGAPSLLGGGGAAGGAGALPPQPNYVVQWNSGNQAAIVSRYDWSKQADNVPNTLQILYAQEDFWILTSLMNIIARTNEGADAPYKAAVKVIEAIDLGTYAQRSGAVTRVGGGGGGGGGMPGMPGMGGGDAGGAAGGTTMVGGAAGGASSPPAGGAGGPGPGGASGGGMMPGMMGGGMGGGAARAADPLEGRYVDVNLQPVKADTMRQALEVRTPQDALLAVVKRMPVRLQLTVDIRKLNRLLAECGNAQLPLEVRQVRINRQSGGGGSMGGGGMMGGGMGGGDMGGFAGKLGSGSGATTPGAGAPSLGAGPGAGDGMSAGGGMSGMGGGGGGGGPLVATAESYEIKVEIFGLVYIYNPPNEKILGALQVPENPGPPASAPPTTTSSVGASNPSRS